MKTVAMLPAKTHPFLRSLNQRSMQRLLEGATVMEFDAGEIIFREGDPANRFYLIESGEVELESSSAGRGTVRLEPLHEGEALGWSWLFPPFAWHFQARATQATRVICCNGSRLLVEAEEDHDFGYELMKRVSQIVIHRLQATRKRVVESQTLPDGASTVARR